MFLHHYPEPWPCFVTWHCVTSIVYPHIHSTNYGGKIDDSLMKGQSPSPFQLKKCIIGSILRFVGAKFSHLCSLLWLFFQSNFQGCELVIGTLIFFFFNVSKPPLFLMWLRELEVKGHGFLLFSLGEFSEALQCGQYFIFSSCGCDLGCKCWLLWVNSQGRPETSQCWIATLHAGSEAKTLAGKVVSVTLGQLYPLTGTLGLWCFAGRLLPVLNTQHSNTSVSLAHLSKEIFPFGQKFSGEAFFLKSS